MQQQQPQSQQQPSSFGMNAYGDEGASAFNVPSSSRRRMFAPALSMCQHADSRVCRIVDVLGSPAAVNQSAYPQSVYWSATNNAAVQQCEAAPTASALSSSPYYQQQQQPQQQWQQPQSASAYAGVNVCYQPSVYSCRSGHIELKSSIVNLMSAARMSMQASQWQWQQQQQQQWQQQQQIRQQQQQPQQQSAPGVYTARMQLVSEPASVAAALPLALQPGKRHPRLAQPAAVFSMTPQQLLAAMRDPTRYLQLFDAAVKATDTDALTYLAAVEKAKKQQEGGAEQRASIGGDRSALRQKHGRASLKRRPSGRLMEPMQ